MKNKYIYKIKCSEKSDNIYIFANLLNICFNEKSRNLTFVSLSNLLKTHQFG